MIHATTLFAASFVFVFLKAFQQRNVAFDNYRWVLPTSMGMAATEVYVISVIAAKGYAILAVLGMGLGAGAGALVAMYLHGKYVGGKHGKASAKTSSE